MSIISVCNLSLLNAYDNVERANKNANHGSERPKSGHQYINLAELENMHKAKSARFFHYLK